MRDLSFYLNLDAQESSSWIEMLDLFRTMGAATLFVIIITPIVTIPYRATYLCTPVAFIIVAGMFLKIYLVTSEVHDELFAKFDRFDAPQWINDCLDDGIEIDLNAYTVETQELRELAGEIKTLATVQGIFILCIGSAVVLFFIFGFLLCFHITTHGDGERREVLRDTMNRNYSDLKRETKMFFV